MKQQLLNGDKKIGYWIQGYRNNDSKSVSNILDLADREGIQRLNVAHSGRYYLKKEDGWYLTSDTDTCDRECGLPPEGRKVK